MYILARYMYFLRVVKLKEAHHVIIQQLVRLVPPHIP